MRKRLPVKMGSLSVSQKWFYHFCEEATSANQRSSEVVRNWFASKINSQPRRQSRRIRMEGRGAAAPPTPPKDFFDSLKGPAAVCLPLRGLYRYVWWPDQLTVSPVSSFQAFRMAFWFCTP